MGQGSFNDPKGRINICLHGPVKLFRRYIEYGGMALLSSCIVDQDIKATKTINGLCYEFLTKGFVPEVAGNGNRLPAFCLNQLNYFTGIGLFGGVIIYGYICPFPCKSDSCGTSHPGVSSCDQCFSSR